MRGGPPTDPPSEPQSGRLVALRTVSHDVAVQQAHGVPLAWLEIMQVVAATERCAGHREGIVNHGRWGEQGCGQSRGCRFVPAEP
jgi:hypothetical protein